MHGESCRRGASAPQTQPGVLTPAGAPPTRSGRLQLRDESCRHFGSVPAGRPLSLSRVPFILRKLGLGESCVIFGEWKALGDLELLSL